LLLPVPAARSCAAHGVGIAGLRDRLRVVGHHRDEHDLARADVVDRAAEAGLDLRTDVDHVERLQ
jgi:hypothetical protein